MSKASVTVMCATFLIAGAAWCAQAPGPMTSEQVVGRVSPSVVLILAGEGAGRLQAEGSGVLVRSDGTLLTAYHVIAALNIPAAGVPTLPVAKPEDVSAGEAVYVVSNPEGLAWSASNGLLSAVRLADEVPGAGNGYRLIQFTAPVSPGSSGGALVDAKGQLLGVIIASHDGQNVNFAVPAESVIGLAAETTRTPLGSGSLLALPSKSIPSPVRANMSKASPQEILRSSHTIYVQSKSAWFTADVLAKEIYKRADKSWGLVVVQDPRLADLDILVDRPLFTYDFTYTVTSPSTGILVASGKVTAIDGVRAAPGIAKHFLQQVKTAREAQAASANKR